MQTTTVKPTCGPQRGPELYINQPECSPMREEDVLTKRNGKEQFHGEFLYVMEKNTKTSPGKQQSNLPLALPKHWYLSSFHLCWRGERKEKKETKPCECFPIILVSTTYCWSGTHHHGGCQRRGGFCDFSGKHFAYRYQYSTPVGHPWVGATQPGGAHPCKMRTIAHQVYLLWI